MWRRTEGGLQASLTGVADDDRLVDVSRDYKLAWVDLESTGSNERVDYILEVALVVTDLQCEVLGSINVVVNPAPGGIGPDWQSLMSDVVREMHTRSGLLADVKDGQSEREAEQMLIEHLARFGKKHDFQIAGSGVGHFDRRMIKARMSTFDKWLMHPPMDVGVVRRFLRDLCDRPDLVPPLPSGGKSHRAMADITQHIQEALHYRELVDVIPHQDD